MYSKKMAELLNVLATKTGQGDVEWQDTADPDKFLAAFPSYTVEVKLWLPLGEGSEAYALQLNDAHGKVIDEITDSDLPGSSGPPPARLRVLFESARARARGVNEAVDSIIGELTKDDPPDPNDVPF
jgi:hypothetical protein